MKRHLITLITLLLVCALGADAAPRRKRTRTRKTVKTSAPAPKLKNVPPRTSGPFVTRTDAIPAPEGLQGYNIALWQSHGRYFNIKDDRWEWQRSRLMGTVEDLFPQAFVLPYLIPMLEDAGAYVMTPRERSVTSVEVVVDADGGEAQRGYRETDGARKWTAGQGNGFGYKSPVLRGTENPFAQGTFRQVETVKDPAKASAAVWDAEIPEAGEYAVYVSYASLPNSARDARYMVNSLRGQEEFTVNQTMGGGTWVYLGTFPFAAGKAPVVELSNISSSDKSVVTADAVKIGGGMGNVARGGEVSGYPRWTEGARYQLQWSGFPRSVWSISEGKDDYEDDYKSRGLWVNWLAGGSSKLPGEPGLGIPVDLSFAFHTDAGTTDDQFSTVGTMPIVCSAGGEIAGAPRSKAVHRYAELVTDQIVNDIQELYDPLWNRRKLRDRAYHEAREPRVPAMLIELLSHQNFADMRYGLDPQFRFDVSRAIYKGMLRYLHEVAGTPYEVTPLPVSDFAVSGGHGEYLLTWEPTPDPLEPKARAEYYIVYERIDRGVFKELAVTDDPRLMVKPTDNRIYSYRVVAANKGGASFPSEVLALCDMGAEAPAVTVVNGFTRISGPAEVYEDSIAGFDYAEDYGVPYIRDIHFTGEQTEFRKGEPFISNDAPGHGSSRATHETEVIAGNTFDFVYTHGEAIRAAGYGFISSSLGAFVKSVPATRVVDLILGKQREIRAAGSSATRFKPFTPELKGRLQEYLLAGGSLMVSGSYVASDLFDNPLSSAHVAAEDARFGREMLGIEWRQGKAAVNGGVKEVKGLFPEFKNGLKLDFNQTLDAESYAVEAPESFINSGASGSRGSVILRYTENDFPAATATQFDGYRTVVLGFPFETITSAKARDSLMGSVLAFLTAGPDTYHAHLRPALIPETIIPPEDKKKKR